MKYVNHEKVMLLKEYEKVLAENREFLFDRLLVALDCINTEEEIDEERDLMFDVIANFESLFNKHLCDLNNDFCVKAKSVLDEAKLLISGKWDSVVSMNNMVLARILEIDQLSLDFRNKFYDNL